MEGRMRESSWSEVRGSRRIGEEKGVIEGEGRGSHRKAE